MAGIIEGRPTTVARLNRDGDLDQAAVVAGLGERAHGTRNFFGLNWADPARGCEFASPSRKGQRVVIGGQIR